MNLIQKYSRKLFGKGKTNFTKTISEVSKYLPLKKKGGFISRKRKYSRKTYK